MGEDGNKHAAILPVVDANPTPPNPSAPDDEDESRSETTSSFNTSLVIPDKNKNSTNLGIRQQITRGISKKMIIWGASRTVRKSVEFTLQGKYKLKRTIVLGIVFEDKGVENDFYLARLPDRIQSIKSGLNALFVLLTV